MSETKLIDPCRLSPAVPVRIKIYEDEFKEICKRISLIDAFEPVTVRKRVAEFLYNLDREKAWVIIHPDRVVLLPYLKDFSEVPIKVVRDVIRDIREKRLNKLLESRSK